MTLEQYDQMFNEQNGCCDICNKTELEIKGPLVVDHNHKTGKIRSLLCNGCNSMIGYSRENINTLLAGINYLKKHN